ncbi:MAG: glycosyltransferase [Bryobacteraceae bacterium]
MDDLLFLTPVLPFPTGNGSAMRAGIAVELLAETHRVLVVHPEIWGGPHEVFREDWVRRTAAGYVRIPSPVPIGAASDLLNASLSGSNPQAVYAFRMAVAPLAAQIMGLLGNPRLRSVLDLDDNEHARGVRFAELHQLQGNSAMAEQERGALPRIRMSERLLLPRFSVSLLAGMEDRDAFAARYPALQFVHLPNVVRLPAALPAALQDAPMDPSALLFVGTLNYFPNADGILWFCEAILPLIRQRQASMAIRVVGTGAPPRVLALGDLPGVTVAGAVPDLTPEYARCGTMIVPLRAGSGTRIKILEAFSYRIPVVSTSAGAHGLEVAHEEHLLLADTPEQFAAACLRLAADPVLRDRLRENAFRWLREHHSIDRARGVLRSLYPAAG